MKIATRALASLALISAVDAFTRMDTPKDDPDSGRRALTEETDKEKAVKEEPQGNLRKLAGKGAYIWSAKSPKSPKCKWYALSYISSNLK